MIILRFDNRKTETPFLCFLFGVFWIFGTQLCRIRHNAYRAHCVWYTPPMFFVFCLHCDKTEGCSPFIISGAWRNRICFRHLLMSDIHAGLVKLIKIVYPANPC